MDGGGGIGLSFVVVAFSGYQLMFLNNLYLFFLFVKAGIVTVILFLISAYR